MSCQHEFGSSVVPNYQRCLFCNTYLSILPPEPEVYWSAADKPSLWEQVWNVDMHTEGGVSKNRFVLDRIEAKRGTALEIGCAPGRMLYWLKWAARFGKIVGCEPGQHEAVRAIGCFDGDLLEGLFPQNTWGKYGGGHFDYVVALDVLEHSGEPENFLSECHRILNPDGQLFLMLPLANDLPANSRFFNAYEHVYLHSKQNLSELLADTGFVSIKFDRWTLGHDTVSARKVAGE